MEDLVVILDQIVEMEMHMKVAEQNWFVELATDMSLGVQSEGRVVLVLAVLQVKNMFSGQVLQLDEHNLKEVTEEEGNTPNLD